MKNMWIIYLISSVIFLTFGILMIVEGKGRNSMRESTPSQYR